MYARLQIARDRVFLKSYTIVLSTLKFPAS